MIFTFKKFRLIGQRARIKKLFHLLIDLIPAFETPADLETLPMYIGYLLTLNAAMNAEYVDDGVEAVKRLKEQGFRIHVLETIIPSTSVFELRPLVQQNQPIAFVIGNEEMGVDESIIALADHLLHIPTFGTKNSLNVSIAFSVAIYQYWSAVFR